jgi:hypothetical protein
MDLRYIHKQKAQLALSFLPIGDTPVQRFYIEISIDYAIYRDWFCGFQHWKINTVKLQRKVENEIENKKIMKIFNVNSPESHQKKSPEVDSLSIMP